jgi:AcrR family transcriptional regulator
MVDPPKRARRKQARPAEIVAAALGAFVARGFAATRLDDIARAAGIAKGTLYLYFATKEELFQAVVRQELLPRIAALEAEIAGFTGPSAALLRHVAARLEAAMESELGGIPKLVLTESGNFPELARFYAQEVVARGTALIGAILRRGVARGEFRAVDEAAFMPVFVAPVLLMLLWRHSLGRHAPAPFGAERVLTTHLDLLLRGLQPEPPP